jgi:hypothetical protein
MSDRRAALAYAAFESKNYEAAAEHVEAALKEGYQQPVQLRAFGAFIAYQRKDYAAAIKALEDTFEATQGQMGEMAIGMLIRLHLLAGDARRGWELLKECCRANRFNPPLYSLPSWDNEPGGKSLEGRRIVVWGAGQGDDMLYARFIPKLAEAGAIVFLNCRPRMVRLFRSLAGVADVLALDTEVAGVEYQIQVGELPALFEAHRSENIWPGAAYLRAEPRHLTATGKRVGLVWGADSRHWEAADRTAALAEMAPLAEVSGVQLFSLQFGPHAAQLLPAPAGMVVEDLASDDRDFADAAASIAAMDLVITIDTATANLAGALGKPVWVAVPFIPDWRWTAEGARTPWYPTARVYRQPSPGDWRSVFRAMAGDLATLASTTK